MGMLWKRCFGQDKRYWRRTYKVCPISELRRGRASCGLQHGWAQHRAGGPVP